jgi:hypothetical protein
MSTQNSSQNTSDVEDDTYQEYLQELYHKLAYARNLLMLSDSKDNNQQPPTQHAMMQRSYVDQYGNIHQDFRDVFTSFEGRIILLGESGIGKTITLLTHALEAIKARQQDPQQALPIFAKIAGWDSTNPDADEAFLDCLIKDIDTELDKVALTTELDSGHCILFLDGLDGLSGERRDETTLFDPRSRFFAQVPYKNQFVITCRTADFNRINYRIPLGGTLQLRKLSDEQIKDYFQLTASPPQLWQLLQNYKNLLNIVRTPLILRLFVLAYYDIPNAVNELINLNQEPLRDLIIEHFIERRYHNCSESTSFTLNTIYEMLGLIAKHNALKYGSGLFATGQWGLVPLEDRTWGDYIVISDLPFGFFGEDISKSDEFLNLISQIQLIGRSKGDTYHFSHSLFRDFFVFKYCLPKSGSPDSYEIEALARIRDSRTISIFADIVRNHPDINFKVHALKALMSLPFRERIYMLVELFDEIDEADIQERIGYYFKQLPDAYMSQAMQQWLNDDPQAARKAQHIWVNYI